MEGYVYCLAGIITLTLYLPFFSDKTKYLDNIITYVKILPIYLQIFVGIIFSIISPLIEETLYRGMYYDATKHNSFLSWIVPALAFSMTHYQNGFPRGLVGIALTFIFGIMMMNLRLLTNSIFPSLIVHMLCDITIFILLIMFNH
jgi:membrane protease YdiL (CAAX protease family)